MAAAVQDVADGAFAAEGSVSVDALAAFANAGHHGAFVQVLAFRTATHSARA